MTSRQSRTGINRSLAVLNLVLALWGIEGAGSYGQSF